jgi:hypothetical protein
MLDAAPGALSVDQLDGVAAALAAWREHVVAGDRPLAVGDRVAIVQYVAGMLGAAPLRPSGLVLAIVDIVRVGVREPWAFGEALAEASERFVPAAVFDIAAATASATAWSRIDVALRALSRPA